MANRVDQTTRLLLKAMVAGSAAALSACATRDPAQEPEEGFEYRAGPGPWPVQDKGKIEVAEFFWFGCPFCNAFEPVLKAWYARQPSDIVLRKVHPIPNPGWLPHAQLHASLMTLGIATELSDQIYASIHQQGYLLEEPKDAIELAVGLGVDRARFMTAFNSPQTKDTMAKAQEMAKFFKLDGVPALVVNGRWYTSPTMAGSRERAIQVLDYLIDKERRRR